MKVILNSLVAANDRYELTMKPPIMGNRMKNVKRSRPSNNTAYPIHRQVIALKPAPEPGDVIVDQPPLALRQRRSEGNLLVSLEAGRAGQASGGLEATGPGQQLLRRSLEVLGHGGRLEGVMQLAAHIED